MGRAFRVVKRSAHLTVRISERPVKIAKVGTGDAAVAAKSSARRSQGKKAAVSA